LQPQYLLLMSSNYNKLKLINTTSLQYLLIVKLAINNITRDRREIERRDRKLYKLTFKKIKGDRYFMLFHAFSFV